MAPQTPSERDENHQLLLDRLDLLRIPRPFRKQTWKPSARRNKNLKQILSESSRREAASVAATQNNSGASTPFPGGNAGSASASASATAAEGGAQTPASVGGGAGGKQPNIAQAAQNLSTLVLEKNYSKSVAAGGAATGPAVTYTNIESAPSLHPAHRKHYCDITGLPAPYTDPKTRLRYHNREVFGVVRTLGQGVAENYLAARGAHVVLK
ncbi:hypothetical protein FQN54_002715 [Arachnomyces sp. PD_36]|nr:hypothetical protein FQN54_002715 [Arachnomyces sp. PD_36]